MDIKSIFNPSVGLRFLKDKTGRKGKLILPEVVAGCDSQTSWSNNQGQFGKQSAQPEFSVTVDHEESFDALRIAEVESTQVPYIRGRYPCGRNPNP